MICARWEGGMGKRRRRHRQAPRKRPRRSAEHFYDDTLPELPHYEERLAVPPGEDDGLPAHSPGAH